MSLNVNRPRNHSIHDVPLTAFGLSPGLSFFNLSYYPSYALTPNQYDGKELQ